MADLWTAFAATWGYWLLLAIVATYAIAADFYSTGRHDYPARGDE